MFQHQSDCNKSESSLYQWRSECYHQLILIGYPYSFRYASHRMILYRPPKCVKAMSWAMSWAMFGVTFGAGSSNRPVALDRDAVHVAALALVIVERVMLR